MCHEEESVLCREIHQFVLREVSGEDWVRIPVTFSYGIIIFYLRVKFDLIHGWFDPRGC